MQGVLTVDRLEVLVVVDNATDSLSSNPKNVTPEWTGLLTGGRMRMVSGHGICCAHHGLSLLITAHRGSESHTLLFDAGPDGFAGGMSTEKYVNLTGVSRATAYRELTDLTGRGLLKRTGRGRGTRYRLVA